MGQMIKRLIKNFFHTCSVAEPINDEADRCRVKSWVKKVIVLYAVFSVLAVFGIVLVLSIRTAFALPEFLAYALLPVFVVLTSWGYATLILYLPSVVKGVISTGKFGYEVGDSIKTTHIRVTHEYANNYSVSSHTESKGCLFAFIAGFIRLFIWLFFCVYIGPFLTFKKLHDSVKNLKASA